MTRKLFPFLLSAILFPAISFAVTDKEMEEARTITAITYLRYANDGSGYLDEHHPKTMAELRKILKAQEKTNLQAFEAVKTPGDYASWTKEQLVAYWGGTFFSSPGLTAKGKVGKSRARSRLQQMKVDPPAPKAEETKKAEAAKAEEAKRAEEAAKAEELKKAETAAKEAEAKIEETAATAQESPATAALALGEVEGSVAKADSLLDRAAEAGLEEEVNKRKNDTPLYIGILAALVCVVIVLVIYASRTMKQSATRRRREEVENGTAPLSESAAIRSENNAMRERYSEALAQKNADMRQLTKELEEARATAGMLQGNVDELRAQAQFLKSENEQLKEQVARLREALSKESSKGIEAAVPVRPAAPVQTATAEQPAARRIYLGRVNQRNLFVRADKNVNVEHSVYMLETRDGYSGSFRVLQEQEVDRRLLANPVEWLGGGATAENMENPGNARIIHTLTPGTAIFEGGVWKVIRKARISFE